MNKIIITTPDLSKSGGVSSFVNALKGKWGLEEYYFIRGGKEGTILSKILFTLIDLLNFSLLSLNNKKSIFFINTSLNKNAFKRDRLFLMTLKAIGIKPNIFIHGFDIEFFKSINKNKLGILENADNIFVLSKQGKELLLDSIQNSNIYIETTVADSDFSNFKFSKKQFQENQISVLFLSRLEKAKGIWQTIDAFSKIIKETNNLKLEIVGYGTEELAIKEKLEAIKSNNIAYSGKKVGKDKIESFDRNHIYILPSDTEGLPITIVEAMFAGMPIICTKVGAIPDFFINNEMGILLENNSAEEIKKSILTLVSDRNKLENISNFNKDYANNNFHPEIVVNRIKNRILYGTSKNN